MSEVPMQRLESLLAEILECAPGERPTRVDRCCGDNMPLRHELEALLACHQEAEAYFGTLQAEIAASAHLELEQASRPRLRIGPYRTMTAIGQGGMGTVYLARRVDGAFDQDVAVKLMHRDIDTPQLRARFLAERQLLARLSHPNIAHLLDGGFTDDGRPYFVMEHVYGTTICRHCRQHDLPLEQVLRLFLDVIGAVNYLHRNLVVHRDIKPSNILVDRRGQVKLLDFGIAKLLDDDGKDGLTRTGERLMTPQYAAPEQLDGQPVTTATDVYSLGAVLYELLTGVRPYSDSGSGSAPEHRLLPPAPSTRLRSHHSVSGDSSPRGQGWRPAPGLTWRRVRGDLDTICLTALRPEPEARYASAEQLGQDVGRFLNGLPVNAQKATWSYLCGKFVRRHWQGLAAVAAIAVLGTFGFVRERVLRDAAQDARTLAQGEAARAVAVSDFLEDFLSSVSPERAQGRELTMAEVLDQASERIGNAEELAQQPIAEATVQLIIGNTYVALGKQQDALPHLERAAALFGPRPGDDPQVLQAHASLAAAYHGLGRLEEAEPLLRMVLETRQETLGEDHQLTLLSMSQLADFLYSQGHFDQVEQLDRKTLEIRTRTLGADHPDTLKSLNGLAVTFFNSGRFAQAAELFARAYALHVSNEGHQHPDTLQLGNNLAATYVELGRYPEAEQILREIVPGTLEVMGEEHGMTGMAVHNLGVVLAQQARYREAEEQLRLAVKVRQSRPGMEAGVLYSQCYLADVLRDQGHYEDAERLYLETLRTQRERNGPEEQDTLRTASSLAELRFLQGDATRAKAILDDQLDVQVRVRGEGHPDTLQAFALLARIALHEGAPSNAAAIADRGMTSGSEALGADHLAVQALRFEKARALAALGQRTEAVELGEQVLRVRLELLGPDHPATREATHFLAAL